MSVDEYRDDDLNRIEAELAELVPRRDRLDSGWRTFLAKEAALGTVAPAGSRDDGAVALCRRRSAHCFVCVDCGATPRMESRVRRWAWPAAFSAMTAVAVTLLVVLVTRPVPPSLQGRPDQVASVVEPSKTRPLGPVAHVVIPSPPTEPKAIQAHASPAGRSRTESDFGFVSYAGPRWQEQRLGILAATDIELFEEVLASSLPRAPHPSSEATSKAENAAGPVSAGELLQQMLKQAES